MTQLLNFFIVSFLLNIDISKLVLLLSHTHTHTHIHTCVYMYIYVHACVHACMCVCVCIYIYIYIYIFFLWHCSPAWTMASSFLRLLGHTQQCITVSRTPLDEWSARRRDLYLTTHNKHNRQISMPPVGFEPTISAGKWPQTYALDRAATGTGHIYIYIYIYI